MFSLALKNKRIAILEDNADNRERWTDMVRSGGAEPVPVPSPAPPITGLERYLEELKASLVMCDHRLFERNYATYYGAEAVADSYRNGRGGVLVTDYEKDDAELSIRRYRRWIPALVRALDLKLTVLESALLQADREVREKVVSRERVPHRTIMTVRGVVPKGGEKVVRVMMSQWDPKSEVGFPLDKLPERVRPVVAPGQILIAQVNIEASRAEDLFFEEFELPDPDVLKNAEALFVGS